MKKILFIFVLLLAFGALADDAHDAALQKDWTEMFRRLKNQKSGLNTVKKGQTLLDLALSLEAPLEVRQTLIGLGGTFACMYETDEDKTDDAELTPHQIAAIAKWFKEFELDDASPTDETPPCDGEPCVEVTEIIAPSAKRALNFESVIN